MRTVIIKELKDPIYFKKQLLSWGNQYREVTFLDSNFISQKYTSYECILAVDAFTSIKTDFHNGFDDLKQYQSRTKDWIFGYITYDLKNDTEQLSSNNHDGLGFSDLFFFQPKKIFLLKDNQLEISYLNFCVEELEEDFEAILTTSIITPTKKESIQIEQRVQKEEYLEKVNQILEKINRGDIYEVNYCIEFFAYNSVINPLEIYNNLMAISQPPFAVYFKNNTDYLLSASPERYLRKEELKIISQPIKGTSKRFLDPMLDNKSKLDLKHNPKERSENIMIVDLVRNDLSLTALKGSVQVEELCEVYSFKQVHQLISTIVSQVSPTTSVIDIIKNSFPMGSMTGAPKVSAMKIIEELEATKRGLYSGCIGYFTPNNDFDFNVVIRSVLFNAKTNYVSFMVGSAITAASIPEEEYNECILKAKALLEVLNPSSNLI